MKRIEWLVALVVAAGALLCGGAWALSSPVGSSPDDSYHMATIWCVGATDGPGPCRELRDGPEGERTVKVPGLVGGGQCYAFDPTASASCQDTLRGTRVSTTAVDDGGYPGGYYRFMHLFVGDSVVKSVLTMRMVNVVIAALLLTAIGLASGPGARRLATYATTVTLVPLGWFLIGSVNPSSWAIIGVTGWGLALNAIFGAPTRRRRQVLTGLALLSAFLAVNARADAAIYTVIVAVAVCVLHWRAVLARKWILVVPAIAALMCAWVSLTAGQLGGIADASAESERPATEVVTNLVLEWPTLVGGVFGYSFGLGWLDTPMPSLTVLPALMIVAFVAFSGLAQGGWPKVLACLGVGLPMILLPLWTLYRIRYVVGESVQPRYLLPLLPILVGLMLVGRQPRSVLRLTRAQGVLISAALTAATGAAIYANIRRYVTGTDGTMLIDRLEWWWPWAPDPLVVVLMGGVGFALLSAPVWMLSQRRADNDELRPLAFESDPASWPEVPEGPERGSGHAALPAVAEDVDVTDHTVPPDPDREIRTTTLREPPDRRPSVEGDGQ